MVRMVVSSCTARGSGELVTVAVCLRRKRAFGLKPVGYETWCRFGGDATTAGWALKEVRVNGIDVTDRALAFGRSDQSLAGVNVVLTDLVSQVTGTVDDRLATHRRCRCVGLLYGSRPVVSRISHLAKGTTAQEGTFTASGLPDGSYYVAAVTAMPPEGDDAWQEPGFLDMLIPGASTITVVAGQDTSAQVRVNRDAVPGG